MGFDDAVAEGGLTLLDSKTAHWETEEANTLMTNFLTQYQDIQGVIAATIHGARRGEHGCRGRIKVVASTVIKDDKMLATVDQFGAQMAAMGIDYGSGTAGEKIRRLGPRRTSSSSRRGSLKRRNQDDLRFVHGLWAASAAPLHPAGRNRYGRRHGILRLENVGRPFRG